MASRNEILLARYNQWANTVIYDMVAGLPAAEITKLREMTFCNLLHTLGHNYAVGAIFRGHLERRHHGFTARRIPDTTTFAELHAMQQDLDAWYAAWVESVQEAVSDEPIRFQFVDGGDGVMTGREMLLHVVNHTTFHRGFAVETLRRMSTAVPATDLTVYLRDHAGR